MIFYTITTIKTYIYKKLSNSCKIKHSNSSAIVKENRKKKFIDYIKYNLLKLVGLKNIFKKIKILKISRFKDIRSKFSATSNTLLKKSEECIMSWEIKGDM